MAGITSADAIETLKRITPQGIVEINSRAKFMCKQRENILAAFAGNV